MSETNRFLQEDCELIVSHSNADMDSLAAMAAANKLYPAAKLVFPDSPDSSVQEFITLHGGWLHIYQTKEIPLEKVKKLIIVDTREARRLGDLRELTEKQGVEIHVYDHHPTTYRDIVGDYNYIKQAGSTTTILMELIREKNLPIATYEATLFLTGIYVDTGSLSFPTTTPADLNAAAWLLEKGGDLKIVSDILNRPLSPLQRDLLKELILSGSFSQIEGHEILITKASIPYYTSDVSLLTQRILDLEKVHAVFSLIQMQKKIFLIGRSTLSAIDVSEICEEFGGGGHQTAASASLKGENLEKVEEKLIHVLKQKIKPSLMTQNTPQNLQKPILTVTLKIEDWRKVPEEILKLLKKTGEIAAEQNLNLFAAGGFVRDLLLGIKNLDLDLVVEGDSISFSKRLAETFNAHLKIHEPFKTAVLILPDRLRIDLAAARAESYARPAALPEVVGTTLKQDLTRRDFTINAMAVKLNPNDFGKLIDFFGGQRDLQHGMIRVLHNSSFSDDPTRIFRAVRYEQRYGFRMDPHTEKLLKEGVQSKVILKLSSDRIRNEMILLLSEKNPAPAIQRMGKLKILQLLHPSLKLSGTTLQLLEQIPETFTHYTEKLQGEKFDPWIVYALALFSELTSSEIEELLIKYRFTLKASQKVGFMKTNWHLLIHELSHSDPMEPSEISKKMQGISLEGILFFMAYSKNPFLKERLEQYLLKYKNAKLLISGEDLKKIGLKPGPVYREWFEKVKKEQLDGNLQTREQALEFLRRSLS